MVAALTKNQTQDIGIGITETEHDFIFVALLKHNIKKGEEIYDKLMKLLFNIDP